MQDETKIKKMLSPEQYRVTRQCGTERAFVNEYWNNKKPGIYVDVVTGDPLFSSLDKFDSGTGWPSFTQPFGSDSVVTREDKSLATDRTEVRAKKSGNHLGHVFPDGPAPTGLRYCINSASLRFIPTQSAVFGAGCFWGVEAAFSQAKGVLKTRVGFMGGTTKNPAYEDVCTDSTGHAEVVEVEYDPAVITYAELLDVFWSIHDPTTPNRQGPDRGSQYRSVIFYYTSDQESAARASKARFEKSGSIKGTIVTQIQKAGTFYPAEEYHQRYYEKKGIKPTCHISHVKRE